MKLLWSLKQALKVLTIDGLAMGIHNHNAILAYKGMYFDNTVH